MRRSRHDLTGATTVLYARRSKHDPANPGKSTTDQLDTQRGRAARLDLNVVAEFTDDGIGASRHSHGKVRPGFVAAVEHLRVHPVEVFALWELSRATRRLRVYSDLMELCEDRGTFLLVGDRVYDPLDPTDQMVLGMTAVTDSAEVARLRERVLRGVASVAAQGRPHGRNIYGYERVYHPSTRALVEVREHPAQGAVVREMVTRTLAGESSGRISADLTSRQIRKPSGADWHPSDIREMLTRPAYRGLRAHHQQIIDGTWPALITPEQWRGLQRIFSARSRGVHDTGAKHLLTGIVWCARCERRMYVDIKRGRYTQTYYHCHGCSRSRNAPLLEDHVRRTVEAWLRSDQLRAWLLQHDEPTDTEPVKEKLAALHAELDEAYTLGLSPRGLRSVEERLLPSIAQCEQVLWTVPDPHRLADLAAVRDLPHDTDECRRMLSRMIRVLVDPSRRGRGFDPDSVRIRPA